MVHDTGVPSAADGAASEGADGSDRPDPRIDPAEARNDARPSEAASASVLSRLGEAVIEGLVHCACSHRSVHPDFLPLSTGDVPTGSISRSATTDEDAG